MLKPYFYLYILLFAAAYSCDSPEGAKHSAEPLTLTIDRFEQEIFSLDIYHLEDSISYFMENYPQFFPLFTARVIEIGSPDHLDFADRLTSFITDFTMYRVSQRVGEVFPDMTPYEQELSAAFAIYNTEFPDYPVPRVVSCISGFNQSVITDDSLLVISLDKYLGAEDEFYKLLHPPVPDYMRKKMRPEKVVPDALLAWLITEFTYNNTKDNLLGQMIHQGRAMYCVERLLPQIQDTLLWGYTQDQMRFVKSSEKSMWEYLVEHKKLFVTDAFTINQFVGEAPFTKDFTQESPGKAVVWIGKRIVEAYMRKNKDVSMLGLMQETDYQYILNASRYNP